jgi:hypothetical protein
LDVMTQYALDVAAVDELVRGGVHQYLKQQ